MCERNFFVKDRVNVERSDLKIKFVPTRDMVADCVLLHSCLFRCFKLTLTFA